MASITQCMSYLLIVFTAVLHTAAADECFEWVQNVVSFSSELTSNRWAAKQVIGRPNVYPACGHRGRSWAPNSGSENEYIVVEISSNLTITTVDFYETSFPGAVVQISSMNWNTVSWEELWSSTGMLPEVASPCPRIFSPPIEVKDYATSLLNITVNTTLVNEWDWYELDAIRVNGTGVCVRWVENVVDFSSEYSTTGWSADQVIDVPDVYPAYEDNPNSWAPNPNSANESIVVEFGTNMTIFAVELYETGYAGAAVKISSKNWETDSWEDLWTAEDMMPEVIQSSRKFCPNITIAEYQTSQLKIEFDTTQSKWYELDAISVSAIVCSEPCPEGQYEIQPCTPTSPRICAACSGACPAGKYRSAPCDADSDRVCAACSGACPAGKYRSAPCDADSDRVCAACSGACPAGKYRSAPCDADSDRVCAACSGPCPAGKYRSAPCDADSDRVCAACSGACPAGKYRSAPCDADSDRVCAACSGACPAGKYRSAPCDADSDRVCAACSGACPAGKYRSAPCDADSDRVCAACSGPCPAGKYRSAPCDADSDRVCKACTTCTSSQYETTACSATTNRVCRACSGACPARQVLVTACTRTKDRVCRVIPG